MPETVELQICDCDTMEQSIAQAKQCLAICQPTSLIGKVSSLTIAQSSPPLTPLRSPSPQPKQHPSNSNNRRSQPAQCQSYRQNNFQGFKQYPGFPNNSGNFRPILQNGFVPNQCNGRQNVGTHPRSRFLSLFQNRQTPIQCYNCNRIGHTAVNCYQRPNMNRFQKFRSQQQYRPYGNFQFHQSCSCSHSCPRNNNQQQPQQATFQNPPQYTLNQ